MKRQVVAALVGSSLALFGSGGANAARPTTVELLAGLAVVNVQLHKAAVAIAKADFADAKADGQTAGRALPTQVRALHACFVLGTNITAMNLAVDAGKRTEAETASGLAISSVGACSGLIELGWGAKGTKVSTDGCNVAYPPASPGESAVQITGCKDPITNVLITYGQVVKKVSNYGIFSAGALRSGPCGIKGRTVACLIVPELQPGEELILSAAPTVTSGETLFFDMLAKNGQTLDFSTVVPQAPKLTATAKIAPAASAPNVPAETVFMFTLTVKGGPFANIVITPPAGNTPGLYSQPVPPGGLTCGTRGTQITCFNPTKPSLAPGTYAFSVGFMKPVAVGTKRAAVVTPAGVGNPVQVASTPY